MARHGMEKRWPGTGGYHIGPRIDKKIFLPIILYLSLHILSYSKVIPNKVIPNLVIPKLKLTALVHCSIKVIFSVLIFPICLAMIHLCFCWKRCLPAERPLPHKNIYIMEVTARIVNIRCCGAKIWYLYFCLHTL